MLERDSDQQAWRGAEATEPARRHHATLPSLVDFCQHDHGHVGF